MAETRGREKRGATDGRLSSLAAAIGAVNLRGPAPVDQWHPAYCGEIDMRIAADGTWFYRGTPIARPKLVALFSTILRKDPERFVLVTPAECVGIQVDDAPFVAVAMERVGTRLRFITNVGDEVDAGPSHPLRFATEPDGGVKPYIHIRGGLDARLTRALAIELLDAAVEVGTQVGVQAGDTFFAIGPVEAFA